MADRIFGVETEYALVPASARGGRQESERVVRKLTEQADKLLPAIHDTAHRGWFLTNGSRFYVDNGHHPEWSTAEVGNPWDAVRYVLAGERWLRRLVESLADADGRPAASVFKTNVDLLGRVSWGCHESVLYERLDHGGLAGRLMPLLVTRVIYTGAGGFDAFAPGLEFVLSPRAMFLERELSIESTWNRAIVNTRQEPLAGHGFKRWHLICGESLSSEIAMWLKSASLVLCVSLLEGGVDLGLPVRLASPVGALHDVARDPTCRAPLALADGRTLSPLDIQRYYLEQAEARAGADFMPPWAGTACGHWRAVLDRLESAPDSVSATLDWAIRRAVFTRLLERRGFTWGLVRRWNAALRPIARRLQALQPAGRPFDPVVLLDPPDEIRAAVADQRATVAWEGLDWADLEAFVRVRRELFEADARFSQVGEAGIFAQIDRDGVLDHHVDGVDNVEHAMEYPPSAGRASVRGAVIRRVLRQRERFAADWTCILNVAECTALDLSHPFEREERWQPQPGIFRAAEQDGLRAATRSPLARRARALELLLTGQLAEARALLDELVLERFDPPATWCHAARLAIVQSDLERARTFVVEAWAMRADAPPYVVARVLWFRAMFAMLDGADGGPWLARLKDFMEQCSSRVEWIMQPVLECVRPRLAPDDHALLSALAERLGANTNGGALDPYPSWRDVAPAPYRSANPPAARAAGRGA